MSELACEACGVVPPPCKDGRVGIHFHHWSYDLRYDTDTIPLCVSCHHLVHIGSIPEPRTGRVYTGEAVRPHPSERPDSGGADDRPEWLARLRTAASLLRAPSPEKAPA